MTNQDIWRIALEQSAIDCNCRSEDFLSGKNLVTRSRTDPRARKYLSLPFACDLVSYGRGIVAQTSEALAEPVGRYLERFPAEHCFETPHLHALDRAVEPFGLKVCYMAEYFLPDVQLLQPLPCPYELRLLYPDDFAPLYLPQWSNALCAQRRTLDVLAVGAWRDGELLGLAGCSADCEAMYQIGVDVLPACRGQGIAAAVTSALALEILARDKVPFYCAAWCNLASVRNALRCGFRPAWTELTAREHSLVEQLNGQ